MTGDAAAPHVVLVSNSGAGHRGAYLALFAGMIARAGATSETRPLRVVDIASRAIIFSPMVEEHSGTFFVVALGRALLRRRTVGLLFQPAAAAAGGTLRMRCKRAVLALIVRGGYARILSILPFYLDPRFARVANDWIYDPQLWDLPAAAPPIRSPLVEEARRVARGRRIVVALGGQNAFKGFDMFADIWSSDDALRRETLFVAAGEIGSASAAAAARLEAAGGLVFDALIGDDDMLAFHAQADFVWTCYAPFYDQASGIFGRSVQYGTPVIVRAGAQIEAVARELGHPFVAIPWDAAVAAERLHAALPATPRPPRPTARTAAMRARAVAVLADALGLPLIF